MSVGSDNIHLFRFPAAVNASDLQIWNNAAFDDDDGDDGDGKFLHFANSTSASSWWNQLLDSHASKENLNPVPENFDSLNCGGVEGDDEEGRIDKEIEEIEKEIAHLSARLTVLKLEKAEKQGAMVSSKCMDHNRRGMSMCPSEITSDIKPRMRNKPERGILTPCSNQTRRISCFWRLQEVDELKEIKERGKSASLSPKSRKPWPKAEPFPKQAATTGGAKKPTKKDEGVVASIQPRMLFKGGERPSAPSSTRKAHKSGRVVPSRYNLGEVSKRSLPDDVNEGSKRRLSRGPNENSGPLANQNGRVKKKWDMVEPEETIRTPAPTLLPRIRTLRCGNDTPRDSGAAKRVADLVGRKSFFDASSGAEGVGKSVRQVLNFGSESEL